MIDLGEIKLEHLNEHQKAKLAYALGLYQPECITSRAVAAARDKPFDALQKSDLYETIKPTSPMLIYFLWGLYKLSAVHTKSIKNSLSSLDIPKAESINSLTTETNMKPDQKICS